MSKKVSFFAGLLIWLFFNQSLCGQSRFAVSHAGMTTIYNEWAPAFSNTVSGDTMYLPGGSFNIGSISIDKRLTVFGAGYYPDSTMATFPTILVGSIRIQDGADSSYISGINLWGSISFGNNFATSQVENVKLVRNRVIDIYLGWDPGAPSGVTNVQLLENVISGQIYGCLSQYVLIKYNLIGGKIYNMNGNTLVENNTFIGQNSCYQVEEVYNTTFRNNVFMISDICGSPSGISAFSCIFEYNVFRNNYSWATSTNQNVNNYMNVPYPGFFVNESNQSIEFSDDFHLQAPTTYIGTDGTQVGIFGTSTPFKVGGLPVNPHIQSKTIAPSTNNLGQLNVNIKVKAQSN